MSTDGEHLSVQHNHREEASLLLHVSQTLPAVLTGVIPADVETNNICIEAVTETGCEKLYMNVPGIFKSNFPHL